MKKLAFWSPWIRKWRSSWCEDISTPGNRFCAYFDMVILDHAYTRYLYPNSAWISDHVFRQNHPPPMMVKRAANQGIQTIVNFRGTNDFGSNLLSEEACEKYGLNLVYFRALSRAAPKKEMLRDALELFENLEYPALFHCKSGADRAGLMSALYLLIHLKRPIEEAQKELSWKFGHFRSAKTGILDFFFDTYAEAQQKTGIDFMQWVESEYDPIELTRQFQSRPSKGKNAANFIIDRILHRE
jgi:protein tyrosine/serine phosphatase